MKNPTTRGPQTRISRPRGLVDVREFQSMTTEEKEFLDRSGLESPQFQAWTVSGSNRDVGYATHSLFRYFGKFPPPIARHLIDQFSAVGDLVYDPMCGSGTTGVESLLAQRRCIQSDVNPLSVLLSQVKSRYLEYSRLEGGLEMIRERFRSSDQVDFDFSMIKLRNFDHWFLPETAESLGRLRTAIQCESDDDVRDFFLAVFASVVRRVSRATTKQGRQFLDAETALEDAWPSFEKSATKSMLAVSELPTCGQISTMQADAIHHSLESERSVLTILHPPYFNAYRYSSINSFELAWLGWEPRLVKSHEVREAFKAASKEKVPHYVNDVVRSVEAAARSTREGGTLALMIGDSVLRGEYLPVTQEILTTIDRSLALESVALRVPRHTEASWVASQRRNRGQLGIRMFDFVLLFRKFG